MSLRRQAPGWAIAAVVAAVIVTGIVLVLAFH